MFYPIYNEFKTSNLSVKKCCDLFTFSLGRISGPIKCDIFLFSSRRLCSLFVYFSLIAHFLVLWEHAEVIRLTPDFISLFGALRRESIKAACALIFRSLDARGAFLSQTSKRPVSNDKDEEIDINNRYARSQTHSLSHSD